MQSRVTIILPTYNRDFIIEKCLRSVILQTYNNWELIIADDGSVDETKKICTEFSKKYENIIYYNNSKNLGLPRNRNKAIKKASGYFVFFIEDDMVLERDCLENLVNTYNLLNKKGEKIGAICPALKNQISYVTNQRGILNYVKNSRNDELEKMPCIIDKNTGIIYRNFSTDFTDIMKIEDPHSCSLYSADIFEDFRYEEKAYKGSYTGEESDMHLRALKKGYHFYFQPKAIMHHNIEDQGGCRLPLYSWSCYFVRNHIVFLIRNFGRKSFYMVPFFFLFIASVLFRYYIGVKH